MAFTLSPGRGTGRLPLDAAINLVPFIDLLSCCISFLLITAVWSQVAAIDVQRAGGSGASDGAPSLLLTIEPRGYSLSLPDGTQEQVDAGALPRALESRRGASEDLIVRAADGVAYERLIIVLDAARAAGFVQMAVDDGTSG